MYLVYELKETQAVQDARGGSYLGDYPVGELPENCVASGPIKIEIRPLGCAATVTAAEAVEQLGKAPGSFAAVSADVIALGLSAKTAAEPVA